MGNLTEFAKEELARLGGQDDEMQQMMNKQILEIVETFSEHGHSGFSGRYALNLLKNLLDFKPITPLTGEDDEWGETFDGNKEQNKRCSTIFREIGDNSTAYDIDGKVFSDDDGESWYTCKDSFVPVTFPYAVPAEPERVIINKYWPRVKPFEGKVTGSPSDMDYAGPTGTPIPEKDNKDE